MSVTSPFSNKFFAHKGLAHLVAVWFRAGEIELPPWNKTGTFAGIAVISAGSIVATGTGRDMEKTPRESPNRQVAKAIEPSPAHDQIARHIIQSAVSVHTTLGPGLLETVYQRCLVCELEVRRLTVEQQVSVPVSYRHLRIDSAFRMDILVGRMVVVEIKAVETLLPVHRAQLLTYLRLSGLGLGLLINFNVRRLRDGLCRVVSTVPWRPGDLAIQTAT